MPKFKNYDLAVNSKIKDSDSITFYPIKKIYYNDLDEPIDFEIGSYISEGSFGSTFEACIKTKCDFILKKIIINKSGFTEYSLEDFKNEIHLQNKAAKKGLTDSVVLAYILEGSKECGFIMKKYQKTLVQLLEDDTIDIEAKKKYLVNVRKLLERLVLRAKICHGDLHLENIMIDENGKLKLIDFGAAKSLKEDPTRKYLDSEMFSNSLKDSDLEIDEDIKDELIDYWFDEVMDGFNDFIAE